MEWGGTEEVEKMVCEKSGVDEAAKDEVGLAASFPLPLQHFTTKKLCSGQFNHGKTHFPEDRGVCSEVWVLLFSTPLEASPCFLLPCCTQEQAALRGTVETLQVSCFLGLC